MDIKISVLSSGELLLNGASTQLAGIEQALAQADPTQDRVFYYRENGQGDPPPQAMEVIKLVVARKLPIGLFATPDFSQPVVPDSGVLLVGKLPRSEQLDKVARTLPNIVPAGGSHNIAVIASVGTAKSSEELAAKIPFFGLLLGWTYVGNQVKVFDGDASAPAARLAGTEYLIVDSAILSSLPHGWMQIAQHSLRPGGKVFQYHRGSQRFLPLVPSDDPRGWRFTEPDGEASYVNCLLTTLARSKTSTVSLDSGAAVPDLAPLATGPEELNWIRGLPFRYESLSAEKAIDIILRVAAKGKVNPFQKEWVFSAKVVWENEQPGFQTFIFRRERKLFRTLLHIARL